MKKIYKVLLIVAGLYFLLLIPLPQNTVELQKASQSPFVWDQDALWENLEKTFLKAREMPPDELPSVHVRDT